MQDGSSVADLRDLAIKCRRLAAQVSDERAAASLRKLAEEYDGAAEAAQQQELINPKPPPPNASA